MNTPGYQGLATVNSQWKTSVLFSVLHGNGRQGNSSSMQATISASPGPASLVLSHTQSDLSRPCEVSQTKIIQEDQSGFLSRTLSLSSCLSLLSQIQITTTHAKMVQLGSSSFPGQVWTKCQQFPVRPHSDTLAGAGKRPRGRRLTTGRRGAINRPIEHEGVRPSARAKTTLITHTQVLKWQTAPIMCFCNIK